MTIPATVRGGPRAPGVSVEWLSADVPVPAAVRTDVAGFVGLAQRGPEDQPVRISSWSHFQAVFGGYDPHGWLAYAVNGFFANGGDACWVVRVVGPGAKAATVNLPTVPGKTAVTATATSKGAWAEGTRLTAVDLGGGLFSLTVDAPGTREFWPELSLDSANPRFYNMVINDPVRGSQVVNLGNVTDDAVRGSQVVYITAAEGAAVGTGTVTLSGGADDLAELRLEYFTGDGSPPGKPQGLAALDKVPEVAIVAIPDAVRLPAEPPARAAGGPPPPDRQTADLYSQTADLYNALLVSCAARRRFALLDVPAAGYLPADALTWQQRLQQGTTAASFGSLTYPWLVGDDPLQGAGAVLAMPGSGHIAGIFARTDLAVGVHKAPANATVVGARDLAWVVDDATHGRLNAASINVITVRPGRGIRQMGARTVDRGSAWRYINVRRLISMIELSLESGLAWLVFEPNTQSMRAAVEREVRAFLLSLWQRGALDGAQADDAMTVRCDDTTTTPDDAAVGRLICLVGVQPPIPAEFVTIRIAVTEAGVQVVGEQGRQVISARGGPSGQ